MDSPEEQSHQTIEEYLYESFTFIQTPDATREDKKAIIREKCTEIGKTLGLSEGVGKLLAQYYFKLFDSDPDRAEQFWEVLYLLHYNATDPKATVQYLIILSGLVNKSGLTYLWNLVQGIIKGDYEVLPCDVTTETRCYFLYYREDAEKQKQNQNPKRHASLKAARELVDGSIVNKPLVGLRNQDIAGFTTEESAIFRGICKTLEKHVDILLFAKEEINDIFVYFEWLKVKLISIIDELGVSPQVNARYKLFIDTVVHKYLSELYKYASQMSKRENEDQLIRDIMNEPFVIRNNTINNNNREVSPIEILQNEWNTVKMNLTASRQDSTNITTPSRKRRLNKTEFFVGDKTPLQVESVTAESQKQEINALPTFKFHIPSSRTPQTVRAKVKASITSTKIGIAAIPKAQGDTSEVKDTTEVKEVKKIDECIPPIEKIRMMMPSFVNHGKMREHVSHNGIFPRLHKNEEELHELLDDVQSSIFYKEFVEIIPGAPDALGVMQHNAKKMRQILNRIKNRRKTFTGRWYSKLWRSTKAKGRETNKDMEEYFDNIDLVIEELWNQEIIPTLQRLTKQYVDKNAQ